MHIQIRQKLQNETSGMQDKNNEMDEEGFTNVKKTNEKRNVTILGDSTLKDIKSYKMRQGMNAKERVFIKSFPGATLSDMKHYIQSSMKHKPGMIILHCGTSDLRTTQTAEEIAEEITNLANTIKNEENEVIISSITVRNDSLHKKGLVVNQILKSKCEGSNLYLFCDNSNISRGCLNVSGVHLTPYGNRTCK